VSLFRPLYMLFPWWKVVFMSLVLCRICVLLIGTTAMLVVEV
jgi:hypothetical protein